MEFFSLLKRKIIVAGHYGSGKTEFSVSLAMMMAQAAAQPAAHRQNPRPSIAIIDLDVINPYFRSRERRKMLEAAGISVYGGVYDTDVTAEIPELGASVRAPLEDENADVIIDLGGNDSGALIINQFTKYFTDEDTMMTAVINAGRPDTSTPDKALKHIDAIEAATGLKITHIISNTHMLRETAAGDILKGHDLCAQICKASGRTLLCICYPEGIVSKDDLKAIPGSLMPLGLHMRPSFLDS